MFPRGPQVRSLSTGRPLTILTIALAWIAHRPVVGIGLLVLGAGMGGWLAMRVARKKQAVRVAV